ncbi:MAG TPA: cbb3-type cytochrome oxidase assembly protein CcoS [Sulfurovum sp.]|nr:MAG: cytochrome oxidase maturation protein, cbb3-type [Sulfurovum sp. 35-42-20]OYY57599.1 MAG: cytochrome oxidase maturation protein, cbb3-type [Sulfurovum sp. 28-43-6]OYZ24413.1 MAG: cytochrome oxidase maturation protein, cbb3-type [Sulfurovum sp. 16-42-52]OYZ49682.1 MAG: cytochrome oxidase maturation protein, cbb3-type [Sulfurovum sp. 24-42-9]OZA42808.1 MAG: cytochrome oxidase maturation protein, cbb3-type [Sulfurovum sp. 17-42-90]OZA59452.1 MAG: cytochrome oxidase maturation protein, cbb
MSESIVVLMIGISTLLGAIGLLALIWAVRTGQFDDHSKFIDAVRHDNEEDLQDAAMMQEKKKAFQEKMKQERLEKEKNYRPAD